MSLYFAKKITKRIRFTEQYLYITHYFYCNIIKKQLDIHEDLKHCVHLVLAAIENFCILLLVVPFITEKSLFEGSYCEPIIYNSSEIMATSYGESLQLQCHLLLIFTYGSEIAYYFQCLKPSQEISSSEFSEILLHDDSFATFSKR